MATVQARQGSDVAIPFDANTFSDMMDNFEVPDDWSQMAALINEMPSKDEILAMANDLSLDNLDLESLDIQLESSPEATSAIVGYASSMLGLRVTPLYAGAYNDGEIAGSEAAQTTLSIIYSQISPDMLSLLTQADSLSGLAYWALLDNGVALLYTGNCESDQCSIQQDMVQVEITGGSAGVYALYSTTSVSSSAEAKALVQSTFPYLATLDLSETETSTGTAFFAYDVNMQTSQITAYYAGVYESSGLSVVYAVSGIGDAYINVLLGGS